MSIHSLHLFSFADASVKNIFSGRVLIQVQKYFLEKAIESEKLAVIEAVLVSAAQRVQMLIFRQSSKTLHPHRTKGIHKVGLRHGHKPTTHHFPPA